MVIACTSLSSTVGFGALSRLGALCAGQSSPQLSALAEAGGKQRLRVPGLQRNCFIKRIAMTATGNGDDSSGSAPTPDMVTKLREMMADSSVSNRWDKAWQVGVTPWDVGGVTPVVQDLINKGRLPAGRALVPGCGSGYDVLALASETRYVVGLDISETVVKNAKQMAARSPQGAWVEFLVADFFNYAPDAPFNVIFDYTFFCAIDPDLRSAWASKMAELLAESGELITLMFPIGDFKGGPPFAVTVEAYEEVLNGLGFAMVSFKDNELAIGRRKGREKIAHWRRTNSKI